MMNAYFQQLDACDFDRYRNPHVPEGFATPAGFVVERARSLFDFLTEDPVLGFRDDECQLLERAARWDCPFVEVPASPAYVARGIDRQWAFQVGLIVSLYEGGLC